MKLTEDMQFGKVCTPKVLFIDKIKCFFGKHTWEYYGTSNDEFDLNDITNERMCIFCGKHQTEVLLDNKTYWFNEK